MKQLMKQFRIGQPVETTKHSFWMSIESKTPDGKYRCYFGKLEKNGTFEHTKFAGVYDAKDLKEYVW